MRTRPRPWSTSDYPPLPTATSFRLINVQRHQTANTTEVICNIRTVDLEDEPSYNCLSYTWGDSKQQIGQLRQDYQIICNERSMPVTQNLYLALETLSTVAGQHASSLWVDAICINQDDLLERSQQVKMMGRIYHGAEIVVTWLGPADEQTEVAFRVIETLSRASVDRDHSRGIHDPSVHLKGINLSIDNESLYARLGMPFIKSEEWAAYIELLERSWFRRAWTLQESYLAQRLVFYCGSFSMPWSVLEDHHGTLCRLSWFDSSHTAEATNQKGSKPRASAAYHLARKQINLVSNHIAGSGSAVYKHGTMKMFQRHTAGACRGREASDARDMLFSLLGPSGLDRILPDYTQSVEKTFTEITRLIEEETDCFSVSFVEDHAFRKHLALPSWVPDYSAMQIPELFSNKGGSYSASGDLPKIILPTARTEVLGVVGVRVDTISKFGGTYADLMSRMSLLEYLSMLEGLDTVYPNGQDRIEAFWRTLLGNRTGAGPQKPNEKWISSFRETMKMMVTRVCQESVTNEINDVMVLKPPKSILETLRRRHPAVNALCGSVDVLAEADTTSSFPTCASIDRFWNDRYQEIQATSGLDAMQEIFKDAYSYFNGLRNFLPFRRFFITQSGYMGIGAQSLTIGDSIWLVRGSGEPWILRENDECRGTYRFVGTAYVHGIMDGELVESLEKKAHQVEIE